MFLIPNATYVTFIRDPVDRTLSQFYYREESRISIKADPDKGNGKACVWMYYPQEEKLELNEIKTWLEYCQPVWNNHFKYLGGDMINLARFTFVGITERMEESLLVMRRLFNWRFSDIMHLDYKVNLGRPQIEEVSNDKKEIIEKANLLDIQIYKTYNNILQNRCYIN